MTLEITTKVVLRKDGEAGYMSKPLIQLHIPYVPIFQWGYGRMDASLNAKGLATARVASCISVVLRCPSTGRTILTHSPNFMNLRTTFVPMIDWITGGPGNPVSIFAAFSWLESRSSGGPIEVQAVVMRGFDYESNRAAKYGHEGWMKDFREFADQLRSVRQIAVEVVDAPCLPSGAVTVDKGTGKITYYELAKSLKATGFSMLDFLNPKLSESYSQLQLSQDLFLGNLSYIRRGPGGIPDPVDMGLQFDGQSYRQSLRLTDEARCLIRSKSMSEPDSSQSALIKKFATSDDWLAPREDNDLFRTLRMTFNSLVSTGPLCERCGRKGDKKCAKCKGAWYCGAEHQKEDWAAHKTWCKAHPLS